LHASINAGIVAGMGETRKITVHVPEELLQRAQAFTGEGVTETVRQGLLTLSQRAALLRLRSLRGKVKFGLDLMKLRKQED
jgi:hypothetical protein